MQYKNRVNYFTYILLISGVRNHEEYLLNMEQMNRFQQHEMEIACQILHEFDIYITTVGCLADHRLISFSKIHPISTVVLDECGQLTHPQTLQVLNLKPTRMIFAGDHLQLSATIKSFAADIAGLSLSFMETTSWMKSR